MKYLLLIIGAVFLAQMFLLGGCAHKQKTEEMFVDEVVEMVVPEEPVVEPVVEEVSEIIVEEPKDEIADIIEEAKEEQVIEPIEQMINIGTLYFDFDKYEITNRTMLILDSLAEFLRINNTDQILIEGHADERGTREYNKALGHRRAHAVKMYLLSKKISNERIYTVSCGEDSPLVEGSTEKEWSQNRRAEIIIE